MNDDFKTMLRDVASGHWGLALSASAGLGSMTPFAITKPPIALAYPEAVLF